MGRVKGTTGMDERKAPIRETAADWVDRLDELTAPDRQELKAWLDASPDNARAFARMARMMGDTALVDALEDGAEGLALPSTRPAAVRWPGAWRKGKPMLARRQAIAAGIAGAIALPAAGYWLLGRAGDKASASAERFASAVGQRRRLVLPDGSGLSLGRELINRVELSALA
ncbi:hypothetical protein GCM10017612_35520 [Novosphingobium resinovorum]|nr:hypothetical protein GCM10017612_35520 [Novosphingobium resinovorum]